MNAQEALTRIMALGRFTQPQLAAKLAGMVRTALTEASDTSELDALKDSVATLTAEKADLSIKIVELEEKLATKRKRGRPRKTEVKDTHEEPPNE